METAALFDRLGLPVRGVSRGWWVCIKLRWFGSSWSVWEAASVKCRRPVVHHQNLVAFPAPQSAESPTLQEYHAMEAFVRLRLENDLPDLTM
jgi:hypothetical protein